MNCFFFFFFFFSHFYSINSKLSKTLKQEVPTRWNSKLAMLSSIEEVYEELERLLTEKKEVRRLYNIDRDLLKELITLLTPFDTATQMLSSQLKPTLHLEEPAYQTLVEHLKVKTVDSNAIKLVGSLFSGITQKSMKILVFTNFTSYSVF